MEYNSRYPLLFSTKVPITIFHKKSNKESTQSLVKEVDGQTDKVNLQDNLRVSVEFEYDYKFRLDL